MQTTNSVLYEGHCDYSCVLPSINILLLLLLLLLLTAAAQKVELYEIKNFVHLQFANFRVISHNNLFI